LLVLINNDNLLKLSESNQNELLNKKSKNFLKIILKV